MKRQLSQLIALIALFAIGASGFVRAQESNMKAAQTSVETWLSLIDSQNYAASWETAATLFRNAVTQEQWKAAAQTARAPLGQLKMRTVKTATAAKTLPGAPDGEYVVFQFDTSSDQKAAAVETVTAVRERDGTWHVGGYFIK